MRTSLSLSATGVTPWIPVNWRQNPFSVSLAVDLDSAASGVTYEVQHTLDDVQKKTQVLTITRSTTTVTVTFTNPHGLNTGDSITVEGSGVTGMDGTFAVASTPSVTSLTYTSGTSGTATGASDTRVVLMRVFVHEFLTALNASDDGNYAFPVSAVRLAVSAISAGSATLIVLQG